MVFERGAVLTLIRRPVLAVEAIRAFFAMRRAGGLGPSTPYLRWRSLTAYGDPAGATPGRDLIRYLAWRKAMREMRGWEPTG